MAENDFEKEVNLPGSPEPIPLTPAQDQPLPPVNFSPEAAPLLPPKEAKPGKKQTLKWISILAGSLLLLLGGSWYGAPLLLNNQAKELAQQGQYAQAADKLRLALYFYPLKRNQLLFEQGQYYRKANDNVNAQKVLEIVTQKDPANAAALRELAISYNSSNQKQRALELFKRFLLSNPSDYEVLRWSGQISAEMDNFAQAVEFYEKINQAGQASAEDLYGLATAYAQWQKPVEAEMAALAALSKSKNVKGVHLLLAKLYLAQEKFVDAVHAYQQEVLLAPEDAKLKNEFAQTCHQAAQQFVNAKKWRDAVGVLEQGLSLASEQSAHLHYELARVYTQMRDSKKALSHLTAAVEKDPTLKDQAKTDAFFKAYRKQAGFRSIVK